MERRNLLRAAVVGGASVALGFTMSKAAMAGPAQTGSSPYGPLQPADARGIRLPAGFTSRIVARSGQTVGSTGYTWHGAPDGGACFANGSGWIYVSNAELSSGNGGVSAVRFHSAGNITSAYRILSGTSRNCAGGATPWNTWLSCEEVGFGYVYETDPWGVNLAVRRDAMGRFNHEAAACDPVRRVIYLTEDESNGCFYRFRPDVWGNLGAGGTLEVLVAGLASADRHSCPAIGPSPRWGQPSCRAVVSGLAMAPGGAGAALAAHGWAAAAPVAAVPPAPRRAPARGA